MYKAGRSKNISDFSSNINYCLFPIVISYIYRNREWYFSF